MKATSVLPAAYVAVWAADARTVHVPAPEKVRTAVVASTLQVDVVNPETTA